MSFHELESVVLVDDLPEHGLRKGDLGAVVMVHRSGTVDVEFADASGRTIAVLEIETAKLRRASDRDVLAVRTRPR